MSPRSVANEDRPEEIIDGSDETRADKSEKYLSRYAPSLAGQAAAKRPGARVVEAYELEPVS